MPCCCGLRVAGSGNPKRSRATRSASGVLRGIGEVLPGGRVGHTKIRARASRSRGTRSDVAFASGCSETTFPRIAKPRGETASRNGRRGRRRARIRHVRTRRARSQTGARGPRMDGRRVKPIDRRGRTARRISVQGRVLDRRTENPAGNQIGPRDRVAGAADRGWKTQIGPRVRAVAAGIVVGNQAGPRVRAAAAGIAVGNQVGQRVRGAVIARSRVDPQGKPAETTADGNRIARQAGRWVKADGAAGRRDAGAGRAAEEDRRDDCARRALQTEDAS